MDCIVQNTPSLVGSISAPPSKSQTMRAIIFAALAEGVSEISNYLFSPDTLKLLDAISMIGAEVTRTNSKLIIKGTGGGVQQPQKIIDVGGSGIALRFLTAILAAYPSLSVLSGDQSVVRQRTMGPLLSGLTQLGAYAYSVNDNGMAPIVVCGPISLDRCVVDGYDSQFVSALIVVAAFSGKKITINVVDPGEKPWVQMTLDWLDFLGVCYSNNNYRSLEIYGIKTLKAFDYEVPSDFSSLAFPVAAAVITNSNITINNIIDDSSQGDKKFFDVLNDMGASIDFDASKKCIFVGSSGSLRGRKIDINKMIDAVCVLAVVGAFAEGKTEIVGAENAKNKESNRLSVMASSLKCLGCDVVETVDGMVVKKSNLSGGECHSHQDHRVAMALSIAGLVSSKEVLIRDCSCVNKTYQGFYNELINLGGNVSIISEEVAS